MSKRCLFARIILRVDRSILLAMAFEASPRRNHPLALVLSVAQDIRVSLAVVSTMVIGA